MTVHPDPRPGQTLRHFTVAVFVVRGAQVLLHFHRRLARWLPPGGHIEEDELPDEAAVREVFEETGVRARLVGRRGLPIDLPRQLVVPAGIQVESIHAGHEHIDLVYFAIPEPDLPDAATIDPVLADRDRVGWYDLADLPALGVDGEMQDWARRALSETAVP